MTAAPRDKGDRNLWVFNIEKCKKNPPANSGGAMGPTHSIDINPWGTGPPHKETSIEWGVSRSFLKPFSLKNGGHPEQKRQVTKLKIHLYRILGCMFYICDPQNQGKNMKKHTA